MTFLMQSHKLTASLWGRMNMMFDKNKVHLNWPNKDRTSIYFWSWGSYLLYTRIDMCIVFKTKHMVGSIVFYKHVHSLVFNYYI